VCYWYGLVCVFQFSIEGSIVVYSPQYLIYSGISSTLFLTIYRAALPDISSMLIMTDYRAALPDNFNMLIMTDLPVIFSVLFMTDVP